MKGLMVNYLLATVNTVNISRQFQPFIITVLLCSDLVVIISYPL